MFPNLLANYNLSDTAGISSPHATDKFVYMYQPSYHRRELGKKRYNMVVLGHLERQSQMEEQF